MTQPDLTVSIVSFNTREALLQTIKTLYAQTPGLTLQTLVVDNASSDGSADAVAKQYPQVELIRNQQNLLFSAAHNQAWRKAQGEFFLVLNSDIEIMDAILPEMVNHLRADPGCGGVGSRMYYADGRLQRNGSRDYSLALAFLNFTFLGKFLKPLQRRLNEQTFYADWDRESSRSVEVIPDSFFVLRRASVTDDLYDEGMQLYFTENDLCLRLRKAGCRLDYLAQGRVIHQECQSVNRVDPAVISRIYRNDIRHYFRKHAGIAAALLLSLFISITAGLMHALQRCGLMRFKRNLVWGITD